MSKNSLRQPNSKTPIRLTPGPFEVSPSVLSAPGDAIIGHRTNEFRKVLRENESLLKEAYEIKSDNYFSVVIPGTGTSAMEAMVAALIPKRPTVVLVNGRFSRRLADIALLYNPDTHIVDFGVGGDIDIGQVEDSLKVHQSAVLLFGLQDTREAILNPFPEICELGKRYDAQIAVDGISALVCEEVHPELLGIDVFTDSSGKGIRGLPGLGVVCGKKHILENLDPNTSRTYYLNLANHFRSQSQDCEPLFADSTALHFAMNQALRELLDEGVVSRRQEIQYRTTIVRMKLSKFGLRFLRSEECMPRSTTSVLLPEGVLFGDFQESLKERGFLVYSGSSIHMNCFQVGTAGFLTDEILDLALETIHSVLSNLLSKSV